VDFSASRINLWGNYRKVRDEQKKNSFNIKVECNKYFKHNLKDPWKILSQHRKDESSTERHF
jgi:hypothetical protein